MHPGGATLHRLPDPDHLADLAADAAEIADLALSHSVVRERFTGTAVLTTDKARDLGVLGYVARASGLDIDARRDHPFHDLGDALTTRTHASGDVLARFHDPRRRDRRLHRAHHPAAPGHQHRNRRHLGHPRAT